MKVYELMARLEKANAGAEINVGMFGTMGAEVVGIDIGDVDANGRQEVLIQGGDAMLISDTGDEVGLLSELVSVSDSEEGS